MLDRVIRKLETPLGPTVVIDLGELEFIDSTGLMTLIKAAGRAGNDSGRLAMLRPPPKIQKLLELTGLDGQLPFIDAPATDGASR